MMLDGALTFCYRPAGVSLDFLLDDALSLRPAGVLLDLLLQYAFWNLREGFLFCCGLSPLRALHRSAVMRLSYARRGCCTSTTIH